MPVNAKYALYHGKTQVSEGVRDFTSSVTQTRTARAEQRNAQAESRRQTIAERRAELEQAKQPQKTASEAPKGTAPVHERPVTAKQPEDSEIVQIPLIQKNRHAASFPIHQGTGTNFLGGNCGRTGFGSDGKNGFHPP